MTTVSCPIGAGAGLRERKKMRTRQVIRESAIAWAEQDRQGDLLQSVDGALSVLERALTL